MTAERMVTESNLGAWMVRCNVDQWDLPRFVEDGNSVIDDWSVSLNYRSEMMAPGHRILLWASSSNEKFARGIWGAGFVTGVRRPKVEHAHAAYWKDGTSAAQQKYYVPTRITLLEQPISRSQLRAESGLSDIEVLRRSQAPNPLWVDSAQLGAIMRIEPSIFHGEGLPSIGGGFGEATSNQWVETLAVQTISAEYRGAGWEVRDVGRLCLGWDLTCTRDTKLERVEVKGVSGPNPTVILTSNELRSAKEDGGWKLAVVTNALSDAERKSQYFDRKTVVERSLASQYRVELGSRTR